MKQPPRTQDTARRDAPLNAASDAEYHAPHTIEDLTQRNIETVHRLEQASFAPRTGAERFVESVMRFCGSMGFVWFHLAWFTCWLSWNFVARLHFVGFKHPAPFDPYPFPLLTLFVALEGIFLATFILIAQNRQTKLEERRNQLALQINLLTEQENTKMLQMMGALCRRMGVEVNQDPDLQVLEEATRPDQLVRQIELITQTISEGEGIGDTALDEAAPDEAVTPVSQDEI